MNKEDMRDQGFLWRYAPVRRTGTFFQGKKKNIFICKKGISS